MKTKLFTTLVTAIGAVALIGGCQYDHANKPDRNSGQNPVHGSPGTGTNAPVPNTPGVSGSANQIN